MLNLSVPIMELNRFWPYVHWVETPGKNVAPEPVSQMICSPWLCERAESFQSLNLSHAESSSPSKYLDEPKNFPLTHNDWMSVLFFPARKEIRPDDARLSLSSIAREPGLDFVIWVGKTSFWRLTYKFCKVLFVL